MKKLTLITIAIVAFVQSSRAGFPIGYGRWVWIPGYNYYHATGYWDANSNYSSYPNNGSFSSHYFGLNAGYGLSRNLNFLFNIPFVMQIDNGTQKIGQKNISAGFGDATVGLSYIFTDFEALNHIALTCSMSIPLYQNQGKPSPNLGFQAVGGEAKLEFTGVATGGFRNPYYDIEVGMREYFSSDPTTQLFANITGGVPVSDSWKLSGTISGVNSFSNVINASTSQIFYNYNKTFFYIRAAATLSYGVSDNVSIFGGIYSDFIGSSVSRGSGVTLGVVIKD